MQKQNLSEYALKKRREYYKRYHEEHAEQVKEWRKNAIVNAYVKLVEAEPERAVRL